MSNEGGKQVVSQFKVNRKHQVKVGNKVKRACASHRRSMKLENEIVSIFDGEVTQIWSQKAKMLKWRTCRRYD